MTKGIHKSQMRYVVGFSDSAGTDQSCVGGKGANLGRLTRAGFPVPPGFTVATNGYQEFIEANNFTRLIADGLEGVDYEDLDALETATGDIRGSLERAVIPDAIASEISQAYNALGDAVSVAVRSSGTAEDLAEASFAGQHDTYLHIHGVDPVLDAVRNCWASLWTARATAYRNRQDVDHADVSIAVVVQSMIDADVSGVMFTANPLTTSTGELVVNSVWGLGEGIVSGIVAPDQDVIDKNTLGVLEGTTGAKEQMVVRDPGTAQGTAVIDVREVLRKRHCLTGSQLAELGDLGRRVERHYDGFPQDIEWALANDRVYVLQSRDITGVDFTWDEDCDAWQRIPDDPNTVWTRSWADEYLTGAITPLFYSQRAAMFTKILDDMWRIWGVEDLTQVRAFKYYKGELYWNTEITARWESYFLPRFLRAGHIDNVQLSRRAEVMAKPLPLWQYIRIWARIRALTPNETPYRTFEVVADYLENRKEEGNGLSTVELRKLSDRELVRYLDGTFDFWIQFVKAHWSAFHMYAPTALLLLAHLVEHWYDGENEDALEHLITGLPERTTTVVENMAVWELSEMIRGSDVLRGTFEEHQNAEFFSACEEFEDGRRFLAKYQELVDEHGHRGHEDRDLIHPRRADDPSLDYRALRAFLSSDSHRPDEGEERLIARRLATTAEVMENIRAKPLGALRAEFFRRLQEWCMDFLALRDNERHYVDRISYRKKLAFTEIGRRLVDRGNLEREDDCYFLAWEELQALLEGRGSARLIKAKIAGRRQVYGAVHRKEEIPPPYVIRNQGVDLDGVESKMGVDDEGVLHGVGNSKGCVTATARVIKDIADIGRVGKGEILVTTSTDPGWTPAFILLSGLVLETGGMLSHGACLSREYGLPMTTVPLATRYIPDGATITVNGSTGTVTILSDDGIGGLSDGQMPQSEELARQGA